MRLSSGLFIIHVINNDNDGSNNAAAADVGDDDGKNKTNTYDIWTLAIEIMVMVAVMVIEAVISYSWCGYGAWNRFPD